MANIGELRELDDRELLLRHHDVVQDLVGLKFQAATGQLGNTSQVKRLRRELARINTLVRQREREQELPKGGLVSKEKSVRDEIGKGYSKIQERYGKRL